ncbi:MAG: phosphoglycerate kinase [Euryarchaeota archaeon RBG_19FT_COMBO_69_17]|nr:MAG: phosphoglycerate kinase [Euryarchaeota archaeon RBG_19FT_COMBO_69_17]
MARDFFTMDDFDLSGRTVLLRVDINSPIDPATGRLLNDARLREHIATLRDLPSSKVAILAHQSRPGKDDFTTLEAHAERLGVLLGRPVAYVDTLYGRHAIEAVKALEAGQVVVLENTRFYAEEEALADRTFEKMAKSHIVRRLAPLADYFILDAFAAAHRAQPSLVGFCEVLPTLAGRVMERELVMVGRALQSQERPKIAVFGGVKADDSIAISRHMLEKDVVDKVLTTGGVANLFLHAQGIDPGAPTTDFMRKEVEGYDGFVGTCKELLAKFPGRILVPTDVVVNDRGRRKPLPVASLPSDLPVHDIGLDTIARYVEEILRARTVILNGPAGVFELEEFSVGTREVFRAVAETEAFTVVGGGHTVAAMEKFGLQERIDHVSTGGGALINFLAGKELPLVTALRRSYEKFSRAT